MISYFNTKKIYYLLLIIISLIPFIGYEEFNFSLVRNSLLNFNIFYSSWLNENLGTFNNFFNIYEILFWIVSQFFGSKVGSIAYFWVLQVFASTYFFRLSFKLFKNLHISFISSLFYTFSIYSQFMSLWGIYSGGVAYAFLPFFIYQILNLKKENFYLTLSKIAIIYSFFNLANLTYSIYFQITICFAIFIKYVFYKEEGKLLIKFLLWNLIIFTISIFPYLFTSFIQNRFDNNLLDSSLNSESVDWKSSSSTLSEIFRGLGSVNFQYKINNFYTYPNARFIFDNYLILIFSYFGFIIFIYSILLKTDSKKINDIKKYILIFYLILLFFGLGTNNSSIFKTFYRFLNYLIPLFGIFRDTYKVNFIINFIYALSIGYFLYELRRSINFKKYYKLIFGFCFFIIFTLSFSYFFTPFFKNEVIKIPVYWDIMFSDNSEISKHRVILFPNFNFAIPFNYTSKYGSSADFYRVYTGFNSVLPYKLYRFYGTSEFLYKNINKELFSLYGINYLLNLEDTNFIYANTLDPSFYNNQLKINNFEYLKKYE